MTTVDKDCFHSHVIVLISHPVLTDIAIAVFIKKAGM